MPDQHSLMSLCCVALYRTRRDGGIDQIFQALLGADRLDLIRHSLHQDHRHGQPVLRRAAVEAREARNDFFRAGFTSGFGSIRESPVKASSIFCK